MLKFVSLAGRKEVKGYNEEEVILTSTKGNIRITPLVQAKLGVKDGDYLATVVLQDKEGNPIFGEVYIGVGIKGKPVLDESGNEVKGKNNHTLVEEGSAFGSVLRIASDGSPLLSTSAAVAWSNAGGDKDKIKRFTLGEPQEGEVPTGNGDQVHTTTFYKLIFKSEEPKMARKAKGEGDEDEDLEDEVLEEEAIQEEFHTSAEDSTEEYTEDEV